MDGYLLDTNAVSVLWDKRHKNHGKIILFVESLEDSPIWISVVTLAEIECGLKTAPKIDQERQEDVRREMAKYREILDIDSHTVEPYSDIKAELFKKYAPRDSKGRLTKKQPEDLVDRTTSRQLGIQENDLWLAAQAIQYNLILVTSDYMNRIRDVSNNLDDPLQIANWLLASA